jgi:RHS repeat-associated protein
VCQGETRTFYDGNTTYTQAPSKGDVTKVRVAQATCGGSWADTGYAYDAYGNQTSVSDPLGNTTMTSYDTTAGTWPMLYALPTGMTQPLVGTTSYVWDKVLGQVTSVTDPNLATTSYGYDQWGRQTQMIKPGDDATNPTLRFTYTNYAGAGAPYWVKQEQKESGSYYLESRAFYDGMGRVVQTQGEAASSGQSILVNTQYQPLGVLRASVPYTYTAGLGGYRSPDWTQPKTAYQYDSLGRVTQVTQADGTTVRSFYQNRQTAVLDALNRQTIQETDALGRLLSVKQYEQPTNGQPDWSAAFYAQATYAYTVTDQLVQMTGPDNAVTDITYDRLGRKTSMKDPDMGAWSYIYDAAGNLTTQTDARGCVITFSYDGLNRVKNKTYSGSSGCSATAVSYTYDSGANGKGRRTGMSDGSGNTSWSYDARGRVTQESKVINGASGGPFVTQWGYDSADRVTQLVYPGGEAVNSVYNDQGLLRRMYTTGLDYVQSATYDVAGRVTQRVLGNPTVLQAGYTYFPWTTAGGRLQRMTSGTPGAPTSLQDLAYQYDAVGNVKQQLNSTPGSAAQKQCFSYDGLNRLKDGFTTTASDNCTGYIGVGNGPYNEAYSYTANGNLDSKTGVGSYVYGAPSPGNCRVGTRATKPHAVMTAGSNSYSYDCNGNMTVRTIGGVAYTLTYDAENRLTGISGGGVTASYTYDGDGGRVKAVIGSSTTVYVGAIYEQTINGTSTTITKYYQAGGQRIALRVNGVVRWLATDHLGSTAVTANETGARIAEIRYKPWGESRYTFGATPTQRRFTGQVLDEVAGGLYFYNARYYDPALGRFISADTIVPQPGNPQSLNRYSYALNNAVRFTDPSGHAHCVDADCAVTWHPTKHRYIISPGVSGVRGVARSIVADLGGLDDLEAMSMISDVAAGVYRTWDRFMPEVGKIFTGSSAYGTFGLIAPGFSTMLGLGGGGCAGVGREPHDCPSNTVYFHDTGFHPDFQDDHNQPYHVWGYIAQTTTPGDAIAFELNFTMSQWGNLIHEEMQSKLNWDRGWGTSWQDWVLSEAGVLIGYKITYGLITSPAELGDTLRRDLGSNGSGSYGKLQRLESNYGKLRGSP